MSDLDLFAINLDVDFDTSGYFSASRMDYRERQERDRQKKLLKEQLVKQKGEKQCGKKARDAIRKCDRIIEDLLLDIQAVTDNEMVMRHRPTSVAAAGASAAIEAAQSVLSNTKVSIRCFLPDRNLPTSAHYFADYCILSLFLFLLFSSFFFLISSTVLSPPHHRSGAQVLLELSQESDQSLQRVLQAVRGHERQGDHRENDVPADF